jgi:hypothetical protein
MPRDAALGLAPCWSAAGFWLCILPISEPHESRKLSQPKLSQRFGCPAKVPCGCPSPQLALFRQPQRRSGGGPAVGNSIPQETGQRALLALAFLQARGKKGRGSGRLDAWTGTHHQMSGSRRPARGGRLGSTTRQRPHPFSLRFAETGDGHPTQGGPAPVLILGLGRRRLDSTGPSPPPHRSRTAASGLDSGFRLRQVASPLLC